MPGDSSPAHDPTQESPPDRYGTPKEESPQNEGSSTATRNRWQRSPNPDACNRNKPQPDRDRITEAIHDCNHRLRTLTTELSEHRNYQRKQNLDIPVHASAEIRIDAANLAISHHVGAALGTTPPYRLYALGERPNGKAGQPWDEAARKIEVYRSRYLGVSHDHGPIDPGRGIQAAIDTRPNRGPIRPWDNANEAAKQIHNPAAKHVLQASPQAIRIGR